MIVGNTLLDSLSNLISPPSPKSDQPNKIKQNQLLFSENVHFLSYSLFFLKPYFLKTKKFLKCEASFFYLILLWFVLFSSQQLQNEVYAGGIISTYLVTT